MKLCDVTQFYSQIGGGVKRYLHEKRHYVEKYTDHEHVCILPSDKDAVERNGRLTIHWVRSPSVDHKAGYRFIWRLNRLKEILAEEKPDIIESGDPYQVGWHLIKCGDSLGIPVVGFYHSHFSETYAKPVLGEFAAEYVKDYTIRLYSKFHRTLVPSPGLTQRLRSWGIENAETAKLGFDPKVFYPPANKKEAKIKLGLPVDQKILLYVGRFNSDKNFACLMQSIEKVLHQYPDRFYFIAMGDGALNSMMKELQKKFPSNTAHITNGAVEDYYQAADLLVHTGIFETFGFSALESQACGTPVLGIISPTGFMHEHCRAGLEYWAKNDSSDDFAEAITSYPYDRLEEWGKEAAEKVLYEYSWEKVFAENFKIYEDAILTTTC